MNAKWLPFSHATVLPKIRLSPIVALLGFSLATWVHAKPNKVELPLILNAEREQIWRTRVPMERHPALSEQIYYDWVVIFGRLELPDRPGDYEPVGLHIDPDPHNIRPEPPKQHHAEQGRAKASGPEDRVPLHFMARTLAIFSDKNVLMSARLEKRWSHEYRIRGSAAQNVADLEELLEKEGVEPKRIGDDAYVLLEAQGREQPFPYVARPRAMQYELEREAWLTKYPRYIAQGLIYQPTKKSPDDYPERDVRVRHAAAALAKLTGKEVFVQPWVEKREFKAPKNAGELDAPELEIEQIARQLDKANVKIVDLNPRSLALVAE